MNTNEYLNDLIKISKEKKDNLSEMLLLTKEQEDAIERQDMEQLNRLIDEKQKRIELINSLDDQFEDYFTKIKSEFNINSIDELTDIPKVGMKGLKEEVAEIMSAISCIKVLERGNSLKLNEKKKEVSKKLQELNRNKLSASKYYSSRPVISPNPAFIDKKK